MGLGLYDGCDEFSSSISREGLVSLGVVCLAWHMSEELGGDFKLDYILPMGIEGMVRPEFQLEHISLLA